MFCDWNLDEFINTTRNDVVKQRPVTSRKKAKNIQRYLKVIQWKNQKNSQQHKSDELNRLYGKQMKEIENSKRKRLAIIVALLLLATIVGLYLFAIIPMYTLENYLRRGFILR